MNTSFVFIRHAEPQPGLDDLTRSLTITGQRQAQTLGLKFKNKKQFDLVITSSANRTQETACEILSQINIHPTVIELEALYMPPSYSDRKNIEKMLKDLGSEPIDFYMENDINASWKRYAELAAELLFNLIKKYQAKQVLVVGHGNIINSIGLYVVPESELLLKKYFHYCDGFEISKDKEVKLVTYF